MAQQVSHFFETGSVLDQVTGQGVAQEMGSGVRHLQPAAAQGAPDHLADRFPIHGPGRLVEEKNLTVAASRTAIAQITCDGLTDGG
jgi:hypothetical protein